MIRLRVRERLKEGERVNAIEAVKKGHLVSACLPNLLLRGSEWVNMRLFM